MVRISAFGAVLVLVAAGAIAAFASHDASARSSGGAVSLRADSSPPGAFAAFAARDASARSSGGSISLVAYSTPRDAYSQLIPAFQRTQAGQGTSFQQSQRASRARAGPAPP